MADYISYRLEWDQEPPTLNGVATILAQAHRGPGEDRKGLYQLPRARVPHPCRNEGTLTAWPE